MDEFQPAELPQAARPRHLRELLFLAEQAATAQMKVLPGNTWAYHYPQGVEARLQIVTDLLAGRQDPKETASSLKPDALIYDINDLGTQGFEAVSSRIREATAYALCYDHQRLASFLANLAGSEASPELAQALYDGMARSRAQQKMLEGFGRTGREQVSRALGKEAEMLITNYDTLSRLEKVLGALKLNWLCEKLRLVSFQERDQILAKLSGEERQLLAALSDSYNAYVHQGDEEAYQVLVDSIKGAIPRVQREAEDVEISEEMVKLQEELEPFIDKVDLPGMDQDPGIPPEDSDEYHTPRPQAGETREQLASRPMFVIEPAGTSKAPLVGYYCSGRKSYYDQERGVFSKKKQLTNYEKSVTGERRQRISGQVTAGLKAIPIPNGYAFDVNSLQFSGVKPRILRDQNGCFYIETTDSCSFSIEFLEESPPFISQPIAEDLEPLYKGSLSDKTEETITRLTGNALQKAEQVRQHLLANHFYPGGGDLMTAQALQYRIREMSNRGDLIQNCDLSEYLECYLSHHLFVAMMRKVGVPARLVVGHKIQGAKDGQAVIDGTTGHAWAEVWDGASWRRFDATPLPKPEDKREKEPREEDQFDKTPTQEADDGGIEPAQLPQREEAESGQAQKGPPPPQQMGEASDNQVSQGQDELDEARETLERMEDDKRGFEDQIREARAFQQLKDLLDQSERADLLEDMKADLRKRAEAKAEQMKDEIEKMIEDMTDDGFIEEERRDELEERLDEADFVELDRLKREIEQESELYNQYEEIKEEVEPLVEEWLEYFVERLPKQEEIEIDEDTSSRAGAFNTRLMQRYRNILFGTVRNPRVIKPEVKPLFIAKVIVDVSGSMGEAGKILMARKLLVFYNELFTAINARYGYILCENDVFSDTVREIKLHDQDYDSSQRYQYPDNSTSTVKVRLMKAVQAGGGTNMLQAIQKGARNLTELAHNYPDYATALYFIGDGEDTYGNSDNIRRYLKTKDEEHGFGEHIYSAVMLGTESQRNTLVQIFGDDHTTVAPDFETLIEESMLKFDEDITDYLRDKIS